MEWVIEPFALGFQQRALVAGLLAVLVSSVVGTWVVLRGLAFIGDALAHGVLPGVAMAVLFGFDLILGAVVSSLAMVAGINIVHRRARLTEDTAIGLLFVGMLALGPFVTHDRSASLLGQLQPSQKFQLVRREEGLPLECCARSCCAGSNLRLQGDQGKRHDADGGDDCDG